MPTLQQYEHGPGMREQLQANLSAFQSRAQSNPDLKHAAVVLAITRFEREAADAPRAPRLARSGAHEPRLEHEEAAPADRSEQRLAETSA